MKISSKKTHGNRLKKSTTVITFIFAMLLLSVFSPYASAAVSDFVTDAKTGCKIYNLVDTEHSASWSGACVDGKISGSGVMTMNIVQVKASCTETGEFKEGLKHGFVRSTCTDGSSLEGTFIKSMLIGKGLRIGPDGDRWDGEYKDGLLNGQGTHTLAKLPKYKYQGVFKDNKYNGQGEQTFPNGEKRVGKFKDGGIINGVATYPNNAKYEGEFKNDMPHGKGKYTYEFGTTYEGDFENGNYHGKGRLLYKGGDYQIGLFQNGQWVLGTERDTLEARKQEQRELEIQRKMNLNNAMNNVWAGPRR
jgi:hypothetical protein